MCDAVLHKLTMKICLFHLIERTILKRIFSSSTSYSSSVAVGASADTVASIKDYHICSLL